MFDVAVGERAISHMGHLKMMGAVQPFISGAISKTVNLPAGGDRRGHRRRLHPGLAPGRSRRSRSTATARRPRRRCAPTRRPKGGQGVSPADVDAIVEQAVGKALAEAGPRRKRMPRERQSITHKFSIGGHEGYITAGMYEDGTVGEIFLTDIGKEGSTLRGHDELVRDGDLDRAAVRRAARDARAEVQLHALRARGHHAATRRSRSRSRCPTTSCAGWPRASSTSTPRRSSASSRRRCAPARRRRTPPSRSAPPTRPAPRRGRRAQRGGQPAGLDRQRRRERADGRAHRHAAGRAGPPAGPRPRTGVQPVRRHDAADRVLLHVLVAAATTPAAAEEPAAIVHLATIAFALASGRRPRHQAKYHPLATRAAVCPSSRKRIVTLCTPAPTRAAIQENCSEPSSGRVLAPPDIGSDTECAATGARGRVP